LLMAVDKFGCGSPPTIRGHRWDLLAPLEHSEAVIVKTLAPDWLAVWTSAPKRAGYLPPVRAR